MTLRRSLASLALVVLLAGEASAECQGPGTVCAEYGAAGMVFLARVTEVSPEDDRQLGPVLHQSVAFEVIEDFKGTAGGSVVVTFDPAAPDARPFVARETVLVYARRIANTALWFAGCSRTRRVAPDDLELTTLRQLQTGSRGAGLEGSLVVPANNRPPAAARDASLGNLRLSIQALDGSETFTILSQSSGYFLFPWLRPGVYRLRFESPRFVPVVRDVVVGDDARCQTLEPIAVRPR
jgi:hypothetical protein